MKYQDLLLIASEIGTTKDADGKTLTTFKLSVPFVWQEPLPRSFDRRALKTLLSAAAASTAGWEDALALGRALADILLPNEAQQVLRERLTQAQAQGTGLRLRLCLPAELQRLPWEFMALNRAGGEFTVNDFLALHPHCSIVRQPATTLPQWDIQHEALEKFSLLAALAGPEDQPALDLERERATLEKILDPFSESLQPEWAMHATPEDLLSTEVLAHVFHFAGHGMFVKEAMSESPGKADGKGYLVLENEEHESTLLAGDVLGVALRKRGVRVAVLGACHSAAGDDLHQWTGVSEALLKAELGAVVGMQFAVRDDSAIAFTGVLYRALLAGMTIDEAVQSGRVMLAVGKGDARGALTPVLYLRAGDGVVFPEMAARPAMQSVQTEIAKQSTADHSAAGAIRIGKIDARYSQGMIVGNTGSVTQHFGDKIDTGGGDFVSGNKIINTILSKRVLLGVFTAVTLVVIASAAALFFGLRPTRPDKMNGAFNIAVASFTPKGTGTDRSLAQDVSRWIYGQVIALSPQQAISPTVWGPDQSDALSSGITATDPKKRKQAAQDLAERINADILVYGVIDTTDANAWKIIPEFHVHEDSFQESLELVGEYQLGTAFVSPDELKTVAGRIQISEQLRGRVDALSHVVVALSYVSGQKYSEAFAQLQSAANLKDWGSDGKKVLNLLLANVATILSESDETKLLEADAFVMSALQLDDQYGRAYVTKSLIDFVKALTLSSDVSKVSEAQALIESALDGLSKAERSAHQPPEANVAVKIKFHRGRCTLLKSILAQELPSNDTIQYFRDVIAAYNVGSKPALREIAAESYGQLGYISQWQGDVQAAEANYRKAIELSLNPARAEAYQEQLRTLKPEENK